MENGRKGIFVTNQTILTFIRRITIAIMMLSQIAMFWIYSAGIVKIFGRDIALMEAIDMWLSVFNTSVLRGLLLVAIGTIYIVIFIIMIRNIIMSLTCCGKAFSGKRDEKTAAEWMKLFDRMSSSMYCIAWFMVISRLISEYRLNDNAVVMFIICAVMYLFSRFAITVWEDGDILKALYKLFTNVLHMSALVLFVISICKTEMQTFIPGLEFFANYIENVDNTTNKKLLVFLFDYLISPAFYIFMQIVALKFAKDTIFHVDYECYRRKETIIKAVVAASILPVIALTVNTFVMGEFVWEDIKIIREYIPAILCSLALLLTYNFCYREPTQNPEQDMIEKDTEENTETVIVE